ncbi:WXG100 family type VII secretion target [Actinoplanes sp. CA-054009]
MAADGLQTANDGMATAIKAFSSTTHNFTEQLKNVNKQMAYLQGHWTGEASRGFNQAMDSWEQSFKKVIDELIHMLEVMGVSSTTYVEAEDKAVSTAQNFSSALPI